MRQAGLQSGNKSTSKKILTPKMGRIYTEEAWTGGAPKLGWTGLAKDPSLTVPVATQIWFATLIGATNMITWVSGMFKNETKKLKHNNNLEYFAYCLLKHF